MSCDGVTKEAEKTYQIYNKLKLSENQEFRKYAKFVKHHQIIFTASKLFDIDRTVIPIINIVIIFFNIIVQFNGISIHQNK